MGRPRNAGVQLMPITHDATYIRITGDNTGDELRTYISDNSLTDPVVNDRNISLPLGTSGLFQRQLTVSQCLRL